MMRIIFTLVAVWFGGSADRVSVRPEFSTLETCQEAGKAVDASAFWCLGPYEIEEKENDRASR